MPKFYVDSGSLHLVTTASDPRGAAIWAVHRALSQALPFLCEPEAAASAASENPGAKLAATVQVSEQGFGRLDGLEFDTLEVAGEWIRLLLAIDRLERRLEQRLAEPPAAGA